MKIQSEYHRRLNEYKPGQVVRSIESHYHPYYVVTDRKDTDGRIWIVNLETGSACTADSASRDFEPYPDAMLLLRPLPADER